MALALSAAVLAARAPASNDESARMPSAPPPGADATALAAGCTAMKYRLRPPADARADAANPRPAGTAGDAGLANVDPPNPDGATLVDIALHLSEVTDVDANQNTFQLAGFMDLVWCDPREAFDPAERGVARETFLRAQAVARTSRLWEPNVDFVNEIHPREHGNEELTISADGTIEYRERFLATLATNFDMRRFPFDRQTLVVVVESFAWPSQALAFHVREDAVGFSTDFHIPEWTVTGLEERVGQKQEVRDAVPFSTLVARIQVRRDPGSYLTKIIIPLAIIVMISWVVFWMTGDGLADRMSVSFTGVLTAVAYQFIISEQLPSHVYNSYLDAMVLLSFLTMVATIGENIIVNNLHLQERTELAARIDRTARWLFPIGYFSGLLLLTVVYLA